MSLDDTIYGDFNTTTNSFADYTRSTHRIRRALFPETIVEDDNAYDDYDNTTVVSQFATPSQELKNAILELLNVRSQFTNISNNIPTFIEKLETQDKNEVLEAAKMVYQLSKEGKVTVNLASSEPLINALIRILNSSDDETKRHVAAALSHLSSNNIGAHHIFRSGGIAELVRMLRCPVLPVINYAVTTLHHLLMYVEMAKDEAIACGALEAFVPLLAPQTVIPQSGSNPKLQAMVAGSLYFLLLDQPLCKMTFLSLQGPRYLIEILKTENNYIKLIYAVVRCIRSISTCTKNKASLITIGGLELLHKAFKLMNDDKWKLTALNALRNLSDVATNLETLSVLVIDLVTLIAHHNDDEIVGCAGGILSNLTCNNILNKQTVCNNNGISVLGRALSKFGNVEDVTEPVLCTLRHCTVRHPMAKHAQDELRFAHPVILALLSTGRPPIVKASLGLVRNCSLTYENLKHILNEKTPKGYDVLTLTMELLEESGTELAKDSNGLRDGVSLLEMVEGAISALHQLAKDSNCVANIINHPLLMNLLVYLISNKQVSNNDDELLMREVMGLIYQLTKTKEGAKAVLVYEAQPYISAALDSPHKSIVAYAMIILKNIGVHPVKVQNFNSFMNLPGIDYESSNTYHHDLRNTMDRTIINGNGTRPQQMGWLNDGMEPELYNELYNYPPSLGEMEGTANNGSWFDTDL